MTVGPLSTHVRKLKTTSWPTLMHSVVRRGRAFLTPMAHWLALSRAVAPTLYALRAAAGERSDSRLKRAESKCCTYDGQSRDCARSSPASGCAAGTPKQPVM